MWPQFGGNLAWSQLSSTAIACRNISSLSANSIPGSCSDSGSLILGTRLRFFHNGMCSIFAMAIVAGDVATAQRRRQGRMVITRARPCPPAFSLPSCDESITDQAVFLVFSSPLLSRQLARRGQRRERRPALFPDSPGGARTAIRRRAAADQKEKIANARPTSTRAAGAGGSSSTMLRLYTDESPGLKVDPVIVLVLSLVFIFSVVALHSNHCQAHPAVLELSEERKRNGGCFERDEPAVGCVSLGKPSPELGLRTMVEGLSKGTLKLQLVLYQNTSKFHEHGVVALRGLWTRSGVKYYITKTQQTNSIGQLSVKSLEPVISLHAPFKAVRLVHPTGLDDDDALADEVDLKTHA
ncbi:hypothetical protein ACCO45_007138 [Purpureocillium lilacinum]|uniref:Uncharacterized protein n=1 Tax=Purpureocillium lilacinum TaxID=33203 RepID=A0ACC4DU74_PURLI